jgi:hypothetical membrane protein
LSHTHELAFFRWTGPAAVVLAWVVIFAAVSQNHWFVLTKNALSDLGSPAANIPAIFDIGMMITAVLAGLFSVFLMWVADNKVKVVAATFWLVSSSALLLIGYFHEGTYPHLFVSGWFFYQSDIAIFSWGIGSLVSKEHRWAMFSLGLALAAPIVAFFVRWPSTGVLEVYGISIIDAWTILFTLKPLRIDTV